MLKLLDINLVYKTFLRLLSILYMYKTLIYWGHFVKFPFSFFSNSIFLFPGLIYQASSIIIFPIIATSLWMLTKWGVLLWILSSVFDILTIVYLYSDLLHQKQVLILITVSLLIIFLLLKFFIFIKRFT